MSCHRVMSSLWGCAGSGRRHTRRNFVEPSFHFLPMPRNQGRTTVRCSPLETLKWFSHKICVKYFKKLSVKHHGGSGFWVGGSNQVGSLPMPRLPVSIGWFWVDLSRDPAGIGLKLENGEMDSIKWIELFFRSPLNFKKKHQPPKDSPSTPPGLAFGHQSSRQTARCSRRCLHLPPTIQDQGSI